MRKSKRSLYDSHPSVTASMEDFESRNLSPELLNISSNSRLQFHSPVASVYSDMSEDANSGWSPPPWRKHGTGWYNRASGLKSPPRSREASPLIEDKYNDDDDYDDNNDDTEVVTAARIALPESPVKGRSEEPGFSPEVMTGAASAGATRSEYMTPPDSQETVKQDMDALWSANNDNNCMFSFMSNK